MGAFRSFGGTFRLYRHHRLAAGPEADALRSAWATRSDAPVL